MLLQPSAAIVNTPAQEPVTSFLQLVRYFEQQATPQVGWRVGLEHEKLAVRRNGAPIPFEGPQGLWALLQRCERLGFVPEMEAGHPIALWRGDDKISLEPGGQVEMSAAPAQTMTQAASAMRSHLRELRAVAQDLDITFIAGGFRPFGTLEDVPWQPKRRYEIMRRFLPAQGGRLAWEMMKRTATVQFNFDFLNEADAVERMRSAFAVSSLVTALSASSPFVDGKPSGYRSYRAAVWLETDEHRCGLLPFALGPESSFAGYADWALDVPMFFIVRNDQHIAFDGSVTFRSFWQRGFEHQGQQHHATMGDWETHLSTVFPEVRLKKTIEMRGADAAPLPVAFGLGALWRGLTDDPLARQAAWELVAYATSDEREVTRREVPALGLGARLGRFALKDLAPKLVQIAAQGLARLPGGEGDVALLDPLVELAQQGRCPADEMLATFAQHQGDPTALVAAWELH